MLTTNWSLRFNLVLLTLSMTSMLIATPAAAQTVATLHNFSADANDGNQPLSNLIFDSSGNLYGTTYFGGAYGYGSVFEFSPQAGGGWALTVLYSFKKDRRDGYGPTAGVVFDSAGNLYGTTEYGGNGGCAEQFLPNEGCGTVFELQKSPAGTYQPRVLYNFQSNGSNGGHPTGGVIFDSAGNLYGVTNGNTTGHDRGAVFELSRTTGGAWTETILWTFANGGGSNPYGGLIFDSAGNLYGTTVRGGSGTYGTVFELSPSAGGVWNEKVLHSFANFSTSDLCLPYASLIFDSAGNLYGTGSWCGASFAGGVFELSPSASGTWTETILTNFDFDVSPYSWSSQSPLILDSSGNLYGTTRAGGDYSECDSLGCGTIFKLTPAGDGAWTLTVEYIFEFPNAGVNPGPYAGLTADSSGNFYGTTAAGGTNDDGTIFEFTP